MNHFETMPDAGKSTSLDRCMDRHAPAVQQSEKLAALGALLVGIAHELSNPLSVVAAQALLMKDTVTDPRLIERAGKIANAADRCSRIVRTVLAMARQRPLEHRAVDINGIVESVVEITHYALRSARIELSVDLGADIPAVWGDADELNQVVTNLVVNAQQALSGSAHPRTLKLVSAYDRVEDRVLLSVVDNGPGIPPDIRPHIFEPFFTTKDIGEGTGIGLAVCHRIATSMGGAIAVTSHAGEGAAFTLSLPAIPTEAIPEPESMPSGPSVPACRLLLVENDRDVSEMLAGILSADGHRVKVAASGKAALQQLARNDFDLILSELRMPDMDGFRLFETLVAFSPGLRHRVGFITGDAFCPTTSEFLRRADRPYVEKPFSPEQVRSLVRELLSHLRLCELLESAR